MWDFVYAELPARNKGGGPAEIANALNDSAAARIKVLLFVPSDSRRDLARNPVPDRVLSNMLGLELEAVGGRDLHLSSACSRVSPGSSCSAFPHTVKAPKRLVKTSRKTADSAKSLQVLGTANFSTKACLYTDPRSVQEGVVEV